MGHLPARHAASIAEKVASLDLDALRNGVRRMRDDHMPDAYRDITAAGETYLERQTGVAG